MSSSYLSEVHPPFNYWESFKIGDFDNNGLSHGQFENDIYHMDFDKEFGIISTNTKSPPSSINEILEDAYPPFNKTTIRIKTTSSTFNNTKSDSKHHAKPSKKHKSKSKIRKKKKRRRPSKSKYGTRRKGNRMSSMISGMRRMMDIISMPGRSLARNFGVFARLFQRNWRRISSNTNSWMAPMLEFLQRPGDYFSNFQTTGGAGPRPKPSRPHRPSRPSAGGRPRPHRPSGGSSSNGDGGSANPLSGVAGLLTNNPITDAVGGAVTGVIGDGSLSRKDFVLNLTTWFRRTVWFLGFTAALTASAPLFLITAALAIVFELVYNVTNARMYWESVAQHYGAEISDHVDIGNIDYVDRFSTILEKSLDDGNEYESESASNYHLSLNYMLGLPPAGFVS